MVCQYFFLIFNLKCLNELFSRYKNADVPRQGFLLKKRASDAGAGARGWEAHGLGSKTTSLGSLGGTAQVTRSPLALTPPSQQLGFTRWSTSRLNSAQVCIDSAFF
jgi:hypothetical protein